MKRKAEIFRNYAEGKTRTRAPLRLEKTRPFRFLCARDQREGSEVDILVEIEPEIGLRFVELANRIEDALGIGPEVVSRRAIKPRYWEIIQEELVDVP
jgi:predicted nucleotidyltransferase